MRSESGFTLVEVLLAVIVVGTALAGLATVTASSFGAIEVSARFAAGERVAREAFVLTDRETLEATLARDARTYSPPPLASGTPNACADGLSETFHVAWVDPDAPATAVGTPGDHLRVRVTIADAAGEFYERTWIRSRR